MDSTQMYAIAGLGAIAIFYYYRAEKVKTLKRAQVSSQSQGQQMAHSSKFPYTTMKARINDPSVWKVNEPGYAREGQFGLERRDYIDPVSGTHIVTHTDQYVNV